MKRICSPFAGRSAGRGDGILRLPDAAGAVSAANTSALLRPTGQEEQPQIPENFILVEGGTFSMGSPAV